MGWYSAVGRPLFFSLPPEAAHGVARALLGLPLPWGRIGGGVEDPALSTTIAGMTLANPIGLAAGFDKSCRHLDSLGALGFGFVVGGTVTRVVRRGNPKPRIFRDPAARSMVNAMGLPNPGCTPASTNLARSPRTAPRWVSVADEDVHDTLVVLAAIEPHVDAIELNASSPNAGWAHDVPHVGELVKELRARTSKPLFLKLPRFETDSERTSVLSMARAAKERGVSGLTCSNTLAIEDPRLPTGRGGLSGRPLFAGTPDLVREVRSATGGELPIVASGGIFTVDDVWSCLEAGAAAVQIYTSLIFEGPRIVGTLTRGLAERLHARGLVISDLAGTSDPDP